MSSNATSFQAAVVLTATLFTASLVSCGPPAPERPSGPDATVEAAAYDPIDAGQTHYLRYCASCHGEDGRGEGPVAEALKDPPTDITRFRLEEEGTFRVDDLIEIIRGVRDVRAHGTREMPVWGNIWGDSEIQTATPEQIEQRINELVEYIRSIQE
ncbi:MAG: cytochrome c [Rhodothermales bacterium]|nr:cytochrome c [Rhodothermales bacterium]